MRNPSADDSSGYPGPRGFTLVELVLALAIMSILMTGLASAIIIASHALPSDDSPGRAVVKAAEAADQIAEELRSALWIRERTKTSVEFTVPDRDSDGLPERMRYAWSGTGGDALTREYNGGPVVDIIDSVQEFDLGYDLTAVTEEYPGIPVEGVEQVLSSYDPPTTLGEWIIDDEYTVAGQYFVPSLAANALSWRLTRVNFTAKATTVINGQTWVRIRVPVSGGLPSSTVLAQGILNESSLSSGYQWQQFSFSDLPALPPGRGLCLALEHAGGGRSMWYEYDSGGGSGHFWRYQTTWHFEDHDSMRYYIWGRVRTLGASQTATRQYVTAVRIALRTGSDPASRVVTTAQTLNTPELLSGWWEADFDRDPRLDHNGDGNNDWVDGTGTFTPASLIGGIWQADSKLETAPANDFVGLATADVSFRNTSIGGDGAVFRINADWSGGTCAPILACLQLQADDTQMLTIYKKTDESTSVRLLMVPGLSKDFVPLRLVIDPDLDTVSVTVNGRHRGTYGYSQFVPMEDKRCVTIYPDVSSAEFDYISVRVSE